MSSTAALVLAGMFLQDILSWLIARKLFRWMDRGQRKGAGYDVRQTRWFALFPRKLKRQMGTAHSLKVKTIRAFANSPALDFIVAAVAAKKGK